MNAKRHSISFRKKIGFTITAITLMIVSTFAVLEITLRFLGYEPWRKYKFDLTQPSVYDYDKEIGWVNKPGHYSFKLRPDSPNHITLTNNLDHTRMSSSSSHRDAKGEIVLIGGSFCQGWAVSDQETFAWKLQQKYPEREIINLGTGGYGTYQSLLLLKRMLPRMKAPQVVIYGMINHHEDRNVAPDYWLEALTKHTSRHHVSIPYCDLDENGTLRKHPPKPYPYWPLRTYLALPNVLCKAWMLFESLDRMAEKVKITEKLLMELKTTSESRGATFILAFLDMNKENKEHYLAFCKKHGINVVDCSFPFRQKLLVPGDGHPNAQMHAIWAECLEKTINTLRRQPAAN